MDLVIPRMPEIFCKAVGIDISPEMIKFANDSYRNKNIKFHIVDIESEYEECKKNLEMVRLDFDNITSFYCLHWIQNQRYER